MGLKSTFVLVRLGAALGFAARASDHSLAIMDLDDSSRHGEDLSASPGEYRGR